MSAAPDPEARPDAARHRRTGAQASGRAMRPAALRRVIQRVRGWGASPSAGSRIGARRERAGGDASGPQIKIVVSDLHMNSGHSHGELNPWESFNQDARFCEFLHHHASGDLAEVDVELIFNGDFFDLLQVPVDGKFPSEITERLAVEKLKSCMDGHPEVMGALAAFLSMPKKQLVIIPGNHDFEWIFPDVEAAFTERLLGRTSDPRVEVIRDTHHYEFDGVRVEHGQQLELMHYHNYAEPVLEHRHEQPILNLPWGSLFLLKVFTRLRRDRPYLDRVRPFKAYLIRAIIFDPIFVLKTAWLSLFHFLETRIFNLRDFGARMRQNWKLLTEAEVYPDLAVKVRHILEDRPELHTVILGHTHVPLVRRFEEGRLYINSGCWTDTVSLDLGSFGQRSQPTYVYIEYPEVPGARPAVSLRQWNGAQSLFHEILY